MGRNIESFVPYVEITDSMVMTGPEAFVNDSTLYRGYTWAQAWSLKKAMQATATIKDFIILSYQDRTNFISASHKFTPEPAASIARYETGWATLATDVAITDEELEFNEGDRRAKYKDLYQTYVIPMRTALADRMETAMWADPVPEMEVVGPGTVRIPYSIPALVTADGLASAGVGVNTKLGLDVSLEANAGFRNVALHFTDFASQIERRLFRAKMLTNFKPPINVARGVFTGTPLDRRVIFGDLRSLEELRQILRDSNDRLMALGEYDGQLTYDRMPIVWAEPLGGVDIDPTAQRLFGINFDFLYPIQHKDYFLKVLTPPYGGMWKPHDMPLSNAMYIISRYNWWPRSLRRQFVICHESNSW